MIYLKSGYIPLFGRSGKPLPKWLTDAGCTFALNVDRQVKALANPNSPFQNPLTDVTKRGNNATLQSFAGTTADGYVKKPVVASSGDEISYSNGNPNSSLLTTSGYTGNAATLSVSGGKLSITGNGTDSQPNARNTNGLIQSVVGKRIYARVKAKTTNSLTTSFVLRLRDAGAGGASILTNTTVSPTINVEYAVSGIAVMTTGSGVADLQFFHTYVDAATSNGKTAEMYNPILIDLSTNPTVQALESKLGRQLTVEECDMLFAFTLTTNSIYVKTPYFLKFDGTNSYGIMANTADTDVIGTGNFGMPKTFVTAPTLTDSWIDSKAELSEATAQFGLKLKSNGNLEFWLNGSAITIATGLAINTLYNVIIVRESGVLKCEVNGIETYSQANTTNITTKPNMRIGAISSNTGGTTHTGFTNVYYGAQALFQGTKCTMASVKKAYAKLISNY